MASLSQIELVLSEKALLRRGVHDDPGPRQEGEEALLRRGLHDDPGTRQEGEKALLRRGLHDDPDPRQEGDLVTENYSMRCAS